MWPITFCMFLLLTIISITDGQDGFGFLEEESALESGPLYFLQVIHNKGIELLSGFKTQLGIGVNPKRVLRDIDWYSRPLRKLMKKYLKRHGGKELTENRLGSSVEMQRVKNGFTVKDKEYPYVVAVLYKKILVTGVIISDNWILTAAAAFPRNVKAKEIRIGVIGDTKFHSAKMIRIKSVKFINDQNGDPKLVRLTTTRKIPGNRSRFLETELKTMDYTYYTFIGWGHTKVKIPPPKNRLRAVPFMWSAFDINPKCRETYDFYGVDFSKNFRFDYLNKCISTPLELVEDSEPSTGGCYRDLGAPIIIPRSDRFGPKKDILMGIITSVPNCTVSGNYYVMGYFVSDTWEEKIKN